MKRHLLTLALLSVATPTLARIEKVADCGDLDPLRWKTWLYRDNANPVFTQEEFLPETQWTSPETDTAGGYLVTTCYGNPAPHSRDVVVHYYPPAPLIPVKPRPVLLVTGAGDNALRSMSFLAVALSRAGFHVYAPTFAHRHGDNFLQAEQVANVIELMAERHPGYKADMVAYSKGGQVGRIYASNTADADWTAAHPAYQQHSTRYRGDVGRLILLGSPNAGLDTVFRWPAQNYLTVLNDPPPDAPVSWTTYYPYTTGNLLVSTDLEARSVYREGGDYFPGQRQLLADLSAVHALPGGDANLGYYAAVQQDWYTTYYGGFGFYSESPGIAEAIAQSGDTVGVLQREGVSPDIEVYLAAGGNPILSVGALGAEYFAAFWGDQDAAERRASWEDLVESSLSGYFPWFSDAFADDLPRLFAGTAFLGEVSGASDGLLFVASALDETGIVSRGAQVIESHLFQGLNHAELVAAGQLAADFYGDAETAGGLYDERLQTKYERGENQSVEWVIGILSGPVPERPVTGDPDAGPGDDAGPTDAGTDADPNAPDADPNAPDADPNAPDAGGLDATLPTSDASGAGGEGGAGGAGGNEPDAVVNTADGGQPDADPQVVAGGRFGGSCQAQPGDGSAPGALLFGLTLLGLRRRRRA